jgi:hypothetical protein
VGQHMMKVTGGAIHGFQFVCLLTPSFSERLFLSLLITRSQLRVSLASNVRMTVSKWEGRGWKQSRPILGYNSRNPGIVVRIPASH